MREIYEGKIKDDDSVVAVAKWNRKEMLVSRVQVIWKMELSNMVGGSVVGDFE